MIQEIRELTIKWFLSLDNAVCPHAEQFNMTTEPHLSENTDLLWSQYKLGLIQYSQPKFYH